MVAEVQAGCWVTAIQAGGRGGDRGCGAGVQAGWTAAILHLACHQQAVIADVSVIPNEG